MIDSCDYFKGLPILMIFKFIIFQMFLMVSTSISFNGMANTSFKIGSIMLVTYPEVIPDVPPKCKRSSVDKSLYDDWFKLFNPIY